MSSVAKPESRLSIMRSQTALTLFVVLLLSAGAWYVLSGAGLSAWDFRNNLWGPAHLLTTGRSPYDIEQLFPGSNAVWMPTVIGTFFPIGFLTEQSATALWTVVNLVVYLLTAWLVIRRKPPKPLLLGVCLVMILVFPPFVSLMLLGQYSVLIGLLLMIAARLMERGASPIWIGLMIALAAAKPQLLILPLIGLLWQLWQQGKRGRALQVLLASGGWALLLTVPLWLAYPSWLEDFLAALGRNAAWNHPSLYVVLPQHFGLAGTIAWALLAVLVLALGLGLWRKLPAQSAMIWSMALNLLVTSYVWSWDFVLLMPLLVSTLITLRTVSLRILMLIACLLIWGAMITQRLTTSNDDILYWWLPWSVVILVVFVNQLDYLVMRNSRQSQTPAL